MVHQGLLVVQEVEVMPAMLGLGQQVYLFKQILFIIHSQVLVTDFQAVTAKILHRIKVEEEEALVVLEKMVQEELLQVLQMAD